MVFFSLTQIPAWTSCYPDPARHLHILSLNACRCLFDDFVAIFMCPTLNFELFHRIIYIVQTFTNRHTTWNSQELCCLAEYVKRCVYWGESEEAKVKVEKKKSFNNKGTFSTLLPHHAQPSRSNLILHSFFFAVCQHHTQVTDMSKWKFSITIRRGASNESEKKWVTSHSDGIKKIVCRKKSSIMKPEWSNWISLVTSRRIPQLIYSTPLTSPHTLPEIV